MGGGFGKRTRTQLAWALVKLYGADLRTDLRSGSADSRFARDAKCLLDDLAVPRARALFSAHTNLSRGERARLRRLQAAAGRLVRRGEFSPQVSDDDDDDDEKRRSFCSFCLGGVFSRNEDDKTHTAKSAFARNVGPGAELPSVRGRAHVRARAAAACLARPSVPTTVFD